MRRSFEEVLDERRVWGMGDDEHFNRAIAAFWRQNALTYKDFASGPDSLNKIEADKRRIEEIRSTPDYRAERSSESVDLEYVLMEGIKMGGWLGDEVEAVRKTTEYDDVVGGADFIISFYDEDNERFVHLAVDATTSQDARVVRNKISRVVQRLRRKELTQIKYFEDPEGKKGQVAMPLVILGLEPAETVRLQEKFVKNREAAESAPQQLEFLLMIKVQLIEWIDYSLRRHRITAPGQFLENFDQVRKILERNKKKIEADEALQVVIDSVFSVLSFIEQAEKEKSSLGSTPAERAGPLSLRHLASPESLRALE